MSGSGRYLGNAYLICSRGGLPQGAIRIPMAGVTILWHGSLDWIRPKCLHEGRAFTFSHIGGHRVTPTVGSMPLILFSLISIAAVACLHSEAPHTLSFFLPSHPMTSRRKCAVTIERFLGPQEAVGGRWKPEDRACIVSTKDRA